MADIFVNILGDATKLKGALGNAEGHVSSFSEKIGKIGKIATVAGAAVTGAFTAIIFKTAEAGDKFDKMSLRTGIAVEDLSSLAYACDISGTSIETMEKGLKGLTKVMDDASMGIGEGMEAFKLLDIAVVDTEGNLRPTVDVLKEAALKISAIENPTKQAALAMDLFGARAGPELLPLLKAGEGGIEDLMNRAKELGITMSTEAATKAAEFTDRMTDLKGSLAGAGRTIGDVLIPAVIPLIEKVTAIVGKVVAWTKENPELVATITKVAAIVGVAAAVGGPILMLVSAFSAVAPAIALIGTVATGPIGLLILAIGAVVLVWKNWDKIVEFVKGVFEKIKGFITEFISDAMDRLKGIIDWIMEKFNIIGDLPAKALQWGKDIITDFVAGIKAFLDAKLGGIISKVTGMFDKIKGLIDTVKGWGKSISEALGNGMSEGNPRVDKAMGEVVETIAKPIRSRSPIQYGELKNLHKWGVNISEELADGIIDGIPAVETAGDELAISFKDKILMLHADVKTETEDMMDNIETAVKDGTPDVLTPTQTLADSFLTIFTNLKTDFKTNIIDPIVGYLTDNLTYAISGLLGGVEDFEWSWSKFWTGLKNTLINAVAAMIAKLIILAAFSWLFPWLIPFLGLEKGGGVGYDLGSQVKKFQFGGMADTIPARLTIGEYVIAKPMTDFIKRFKAIPQNLVNAVIRGLPTPAPAFAGGGPVGTSNITSTSFGETKIYVDIHDNKISDDVDIRRLAMTVSNEILRKINLNRRH